MQDFANDSVNFFNKCAKPDRKGIRIVINFVRVHEDFASMCHGICGDWIDWIYH